MKRKLCSVADMATKWNISERSVRNYCNAGRIEGAFLEGKTWRIPEDAGKPARKRKQSKKNPGLLERLRQEKEAGISGGIYHRVQIDLTYNSNHIEGSTLTHDQTRYIFETNTIGTGNEVLNADDIVETTNHFSCIDMIIEHANYPLSESFIKDLHRQLKSGTSDSRVSWFAVGDYKRLPNEVGGRETASPEDAGKELRKLLAWYNGLSEVTFDDILEFHYRFEIIHPFQDGNGRVGRLIMFKECLRNSIVPFIIGDDMIPYYYNGLTQWPKEKGYLRDTCLAAQDRFITALDYFRIDY